MPGIVDCCSVMRSLSTSIAQAAQISLQKRGLLRRAARPLAIYYTR